jgi:hypothetical protein
MELGDFLNSINLSKKDLMKEDPNCEKQYLPFIVNKSLSYFIDSLFYSNKMNELHFLDKKMQYDYLRHKLVKKKRFSKWFKPDELESLEYIKEYYGYSTQKAKEIMCVLTPDQILEIKAKLNKGGAKNQKT